MKFSIKSSSTYRRCIMLVFIDEKKEHHSAIVEFKLTKGVNGEKSLSGTIYTNQFVLEGIEKGWRILFDDEEYCITYANPIDEGDAIVIDFDAVHKFFYDFSKSVKHAELNGSNTMRAYLDFIFKDTDYSYNLVATVDAFEKESFGFKNRLDLFNDIVQSSGVEFSVVGHVVRIVKEVGTDLSTIVKKGFNMNELRIEKDISTFITYKKGYGAWFNEDDHSKGRLEVEYLSPLASIYGKLEGDPIIDERYSVKDSLQTRLANEVENSYEIALTVDMVDLNGAGYEYDRPREGDYIMAINEELGFEKRIRIMSYVTEFDTTGEVINHEIFCGSENIISKLNNSEVDLIKKVEDMDTQVNIVQIAANGKNRIFRGIDKPTQGMSKNDLWYKPVGDGETEMYRYDGVDWRLEKVSAGLLQGRLDAENGDVDLINVNVSTLVGNRSEFVKSWWNAINSRATIDGNELRFTHTDGSYTSMRADGFKRFIAGSGREYHSLIYMVGYVLGGQSVRWAQLPNEFKGKPFTPYIVIADSLQAENNGQSINRFVVTGHPNYQNDYTNARVPLIGYKLLTDGTNIVTSDVQGLLIVVY